MSRRPSRKRSRRWGRLIRCCISAQRATKTISRATRARTTNAARPSGHGRGDFDNANQPAAAAPAEPSKGNAVYKIDREGFVTEVSPGTSGDLFHDRKGRSAFRRHRRRRGDLTDRSCSARRRWSWPNRDAKEVTALAESPDGRIILGLSNTGGLSAMTDGYTTLGNSSSARSWMRHRSADSG